MALRVPLRAFIVPLPDSLQSNPYHWLSVPLHAAICVERAFMVPLHPRDRLNPAPTVLIVTVTVGVAKETAPGERRPILILPVETVRLN